jgi:hypothetical protein
MPSNFLRKQSTPIEFESDVLKDASIMEIECR